MKDTIIRIFATIVGFIIGYFIILFVIELFEKDKITIPLEQSTKTEFRNGFMSGCLEGGTVEDCNCYYNSIIGQLGHDGLIDLASEYLKTEQIPKKVIDEIVKDCQ